LHEVRQGLGVRADDLVEFRVERVIRRRYNVRLVGGFDESAYVGRALLPFGRERIEGASTLLVTFPRLRIGVTRPSFGLRRRLEGVHAHRLYLGADEHKFIGPQARLDGLATAVELLGSEAEALAIPQERIVCVGTSMGGVLALMTGLSHGVGRIAVGAAPFRVGSSLRRFLHSEKRWAGKKKKRSPDLIELARGENGADPVEFLDRMVFDLAAACSSPCRIDVLTSPNDYAGASAHEFAEFAAGNPYLEVAVHEGAYAKHGVVGDAFYPFFRELLADPGSAALVKAPP
jgi:pimeloyl-ACP methyl ester carboxylesterase